MPIRFPCESCGQRLSVSSRKAGQRARCPKCRQSLTIPAAVGSTGSGESLAEAAAEQEEDQDPFSQFVVYDRESEWIYESDEEAVGTADPPAVLDRDKVDRDKVDRDKVAVPRSILYAQGILLGVVALVCFALGILIGSSGSSPSVSEDDTPQPCVVSGQVTYVGQGQATEPDEGAVVMLLPQGARPDEKAAVEGLRPQDPPADPQHTGLLAIREIGGAYTRADAEGRFQIRVPDRGKYFLLVVSHHGRRPANQPLNKTDLAQLGRYLLPAPELLGENQYQWREESIRGDRTVNVAFP